MPGSEAGSAASQALFELSWDKQTLAATAQNTEVQGSGCVCSITPAP